MVKRAPDGYSSIEAFDADRLKLDEQVCLPACAAALHTQRRPLLVFLTVQQGVAVWSSVVAGLGRSQQEQPGPSC